MKTGEMRGDWPGTRRFQGKNRKKGLPPFQAPKPPFPLKTDSRAGLKKEHAVFLTQEIASSLMAKNTAFPFF
ncbi:MAG: hypothetical protein HFE94_01950 [Acutalibacter sp.]|nr:hypothetical protein [Acutalibacter sp.]